MGGRKKKNRQYVESRELLGALPLMLHTLVLCRLYQLHIQEYAGLDQIIKMGRVCLGSNVSTGVRIPRTHIKAGWAWRHPAAPELGRQRSGIPRASWLATLARVSAQMHTQSHVQAAC